MAVELDQRRPGDPAARGLSTLWRAAPLSAGAILRPSFSTFRDPCREVGLAHFFFGPEPGKLHETAMNDLQSEHRDTARGARPRGRADRARAARRRTRCASTSTTPTGWTWGSASGSRPSFATSSPTTRSRSPRRAPSGPLTKPEHFRRFLGRRVRVRTREELEGRSNFTGTIAAADERGVEVDARRRRRDHPARAHPPLQPRAGGSGRSRS